VARFKFNDGWWQRVTARSVSDKELEKLDEVNNEAAAKTWRAFDDSVKDLLLPKKTLPERSERRQSRKMPRLFKAVLFVGFSGLGLLGVRILPATASEGWLPVIALLAALGLIVAALIEVKRSN
jgi:hypothetical protein